MAPPKDAQVENKFNLVFFASQAATENDQIWYVNKDSGSAVECQIYLMPDLS